MLTTERYKNLILIQYRTDFNRAIIEVLTGLNVQAVNNVLLQISKKFNIDTAEGDQLDKLGELVGLSRDFITVGDYTNDTVYRFFIKLKIVKNNISARLVDFEKLLLEFFEGDVRIQDYQDMSISYLLFSLDEDVKNIIISHKELLPAPAGVNYYLVIELDPPTFSYIDVENSSELSDQSVYNRKINYMQDVDSLSEATLDADYLDYDNFL